MQCGKALQQRRGFVFTPGNVFHPCGLCATVMSFMLEESVASVYCCNQGTTSTSRHTLHASHKQQEPDVSCDSLVDGDGASAETGTFTRF